MRCRSLQMPIHFSEATSAPLVGDFVCAVVAGFITFQGTQQSTAFLALMMRVAYGWVLSRLIYRRGHHTWPVNTLSSHAADVYSWSSSHPHAGAEHSDRSVRVSCASRGSCRLLDHAYPGVEGLLATPLSYMVSQIAYSCLVLQVRAPPVPPLAIEGIMLFHMASGFLLLEHVEACIDEI